MEDFDERMSDGPEQMPEQPIGSADAGQILSQLEFVTNWRIACAEVHN